MAAKVACIEPIRRLRPLKLSKIKPQGRFAVTKGAVQQPVRRSVEAEEDIIAIAEQGVHMFGAGQAKRYHDELFALFDLIAVNLASSANGMRLIRQ